MTTLSLFLSFILKYSLSGSPCAFEGFKSHLPPNELLSPWKGDEMCYLPKGKS